METTEEKKERMFDGKKLLKLSVIWFLVIMVLFAIANEKSFQLLEQTETELEQLVDTPLNDIDLGGYTIGKVPKDIPIFGVYAIIMEDGNYLREDTPREEYLPIRSVTAKYTTSTDSFSPNASITINGKKYGLHYEELLTALGDDYFVPLQHPGEMGELGSIIWYQDRENNLQASLHMHRNQITFTLRALEEIKASELTFLAETFEMAHLKYPWLLRLCSPFVILIPLFGPIIPYSSEVYQITVETILLSLIPFVLAASKRGKKKFIVFLCVLSSIYWIGNLLLFVASLFSR